MNHDDIRQLLPDFVYGKLLEDLEKKILEHIQTCKDCTEEVEQLKVLFANVEQEKIWNPSEQYFTALLPRIHQRIEKKRFFDVPQWFQRLVLPLAALTVLVVFSIQLFTIDKNKHGELQSLLQQMSLEELQQVDETISPTANGESQEIQKSESTLLANYLKSDSLSLTSVEYDVQEDIAQLSDEEANHLLVLLEE